MAVNDQKTFDNRSLDAVLEALVDVEPPADLPRRVMQAIDGRHHAERDVVVRWVPAAAVLMLLLVAATVAMFVRGTVTQPPAIAGPGRMRTAAAFTAPGVPPDPPLDRRAIGVRRVAAASREKPPQTRWEHALPSIEPPRPIHLEPIDTTPLADDPIAIEPLSIARLEIERLPAQMENEERRMH